MRFFIKLIQRFIWVRFFIFIECLLGFFFRNIFFPLALFVNDFLGCSSSESFSYKCYAFTGSSFFFKFDDMGIFVEKKNNLGFYFLRDPLHLNILLGGVDFKSNFFLVQFLKI